MKKRVQTVHADMPREDAIQTRLAAATKGPWAPRLYADNEDCGWDVVLPCDREGFEIGAIRCTDIHENAENDAAFIAAAREDVPYLLAEVARLRRIVEAFTYHTLTWNPDCAVHLESREKDRLTWAVKLAEDKE